MSRLKASVLAEWPQYVVKRFAGEIFGEKSVLGTDLPRQWRSRLPSLILRDARYQFHQPRNRVA